MLWHIICVKIIKRPDMKNLLLLFLPAVLAVTSCSRTGSSGHFITGSSTSTGSFSATGSSINTDGAAGAKIVIDGRSSSGSRMLIILNPYSGVTGTFPVDDTIINSRCEYIPASGSPVNISAHGTVTLTSVTPNIVGTYSFTGRDSGSYSGSFNVPMP